MQTNGLAGDTVTQELYVDARSVKANAGNDIHACYNEAVTLSVTNGPYYYSWSPSTGLSDPTIANPVSKYTSTIKYIVTVSNYYGCVERDTITVFRADSIPAVSWEKMNVTTKDPIARIQIVNDTLGFAIASSKVLVTNDGGENWNERGVLGGVDQFQTNFNDIQFITPDTGFVAVSKLLFGTTDGGKSYFRINVTYNYGGILDIEFINSKVGYAAVNSPYGNKTSIFKTSDGGKSWESQITIEGQLYKLKCLSNGTCLAVGNDQSLTFGSLFLRTTDGKNWTKPQYAASNYRNLFDIAFIDDTIGFAVGAGGKVWKTVDGGASWKVNYTLPDDLNSIKFFDKDTGFIGSHNGHIFQTMNGGLCWQDMGKIHTTWIKEIHVYKDIAFIASGETIFGKGIIYRANILELFSKPQTITFEALSEKSFGNENFLLEAKASSGLPVVYTSSNDLVAKVNSNSITIVGAGTAIITASQIGNTEYRAARSVSQSLVVNKVADSLSFAFIQEKTFGDASFTLTASSSSGLATAFSIVSGPASLSVDNLTLTGAGVVTVKAYHEGNSNYIAAAVSQSFVVKKANQTISFAPLHDKAYGGNTFDLSASASSGLPLTFSVVSGSATVSGRTLTLSGIGPVSLKAVQDGNANFEAATPVIQSFCVMPPTPEITASGIMLTSSSIIGNQWYLNGKEIRGANTSNYQATTSGDYTVLVTGDCGEGVSSNAYHVTITAIEPAISKQIMFYPNPARENVVVELSDEIIFVSAKLLDSNGKQVATQTNHESKIIFHIKNLGKGVYLLELQTKNGLIVRKVIVQ